MRSETDGLGFASEDRDRRPARRNVAEPLEQLAEQVGELSALGFIETPHACGLGFEQRRECTLGNLHPGGGEPNVHTSAVTGVRSADDQARILEAMKADGHATRGQEERARERRGREFPLGSRPIDLCEDIEIPLVTQAVGGGDVIQGGLEIVGRTKHAGDHLETRCVEVGSPTTPLLEDVVHTVCQDHSFSACRFRLETCPSSRNLI